MSITQKFELSSKKLHGCLILSYESGILKTVTNAFKRPLNAVQEATIKRVIPFNINDIPKIDYAGIGLDCKALEPTGGQRVALFCDAYKKTYGTSYLVSKKDGALLKQLPAKDETEFAEIVATYFACDEWWASPKNIGGMANRINELRQWNSTTKDKTTASKWHFPNGFSKAREQECKTNEELQAYWRHLRALGFKKTRVGIVETWKKSTDLI